VVQGRSRTLLAVVVGTAAALLGCGSGSSSGSDQTVATAARLRLVRVGTFDQPIYATGAPGDTKRLFVVEKKGRIVVLDHGRQHLFLDISKLVESSGGEQGLLSMVFAPDYQKSRRFYVAYTIPGNDVRVAEYRRSARKPGVADRSSGRTLITVAHKFANHNGGQLQFGPDGYLYVGVGDGGSEDDPDNLGQNTGVLDGKILRIAPRPNGGYSVPSSNPFVGRSGFRPEIWAYGLRNPWRFSFDRVTGALAIGDVGQDKEEEIDYARRGHGKGANYGWSVYEGDQRFKPGSAPGAAFPALVKLHSAGYCAIIGGYVVRDKSLHSLNGRYLYGDLCHSGIQAVKLGGGHATGDRATGLSVSQLASFGQDSAGRVYAVSLAGPVYRFAGG
jgi:glucose/arabinose dehydrogenase